jgi:hypothetical protein
MGGYEPYQRICDQRQIGTRMPPHPNRALIHRSGSLPDSSGFRVFVTFWNSHLFAGDPWMLVDRDKILRII